MVAGVLFAVGCFITGATARPEIHWIASAIGQVVVISESALYRSLLPPLRR
jgi:hypothetical protein